MNRLCERSFVQNESKMRVRVREKFVGTYSTHRAKLRRHDKIGSAFVSVLTYDQEICHDALS